MNLNELVITKIESVDIYYLVCLGCGYKNTINNIKKICPICNADLKVAHLENIEC